MIMTILSALSSIRMIILLCVLGGISVALLKVKGKEFFHKRKSNNPNSFKELVEEKTDETPSQRWNRVYRKKKDKK